MTQLFDMSRSSATSSQLTSSFNSDIISVLPMKPLTLSLTTKNPRLEIHAGPTSSEGVEKDPKNTESIKESDKEVRMDWFFLCSRNRSHIKLDVSSTDFMNARIQRPNVISWTSLQQRYTGAICYSPSSSPAVQSSTAGLLWELSTHVALDE